MRQGKENYNRRSERVAEARSRMALWSIVKTLSMLEKNGKPLDGSGKGIRRSSFYRITEAWRMQLVRNRSASL